MKGKIFKKLILLIFLFLLLGCQGKKKNEITFMVGGAPNEVAFWNKLAKEFEKETGIKVEILKQPADTEQRRQGLVIALTSKNKDPDVFLMDVVWIPQFAASHWLEPLNSYLKRDSQILKGFFKNVIKTVDVYHQNIIALPVYIDGGILYYRKDLLQKAGFKNPPQTWEDLVDYSLKIQRIIKKENPDFYGFVWQGAQYEGLVCNFLEIATSNKGGIFFKNGRIILNIPQNIKALEFMKDLIHKYKISPPNTFTEMKEEETRIFFQKGNALFERNWPYAWMLHQAQNSPVKNKIDITELPHFKGGKSTSALGGWHIGISKYSDNKKASWKFVKFVTSYKVQKELALNLGWNPARTDVYKDKEILKTLPHFKKLRVIFNNLVPRPKVPYYPLISETLQRYINGALAGKIEPAKALAQAEKEINLIVNRYEK